MRYFSLRQQLMLFILALFSFGLFYLKFHHPSPPLQETASKEFVVEVVGEVRKPGVYLFQHSPTLKEAIDKAGGLKKPAVFEADSFSGPLATGTLIKIRRDSQQEVRIEIGSMEANKLLIFNIPLDLNRVSLEDLCLLPGIGESLAREIIAYRERRKGFRSVEELKHVKGIGEKKYRSMKTYLTTNPR